VSVVDAGAGAVDVFAGAAGRNGSGQRDLGWTRGATGSAGGAGLVGASYGGGIEQHQTAPVNGAGASGGGEGLGLWVVTLAHEETELCAQQQRLKAGG